MNATIDNLARAREALSRLTLGELAQLTGDKGGGALHESQRPGYTYISREDWEYFDPEQTGKSQLLKLAERACPEWSKPNFRPSVWRREALRAVRKYVDVREATPETALAFLLRKGIQTITNDWYLTVPREYQDYCQITSSDAVAEWHGPLYPSTVAGRVARGDRFPEGKIIGEDIVLVNYKFGLIEAFDRELFDDDMTGQIRQRAQRLGQAMAITENAYAALRFIGSASQYSNLIVPASNYTTTDANGNPVPGPFSATLFASGAGAYGNRPTNFGALSLNLLKQAYSNLLNARDPQQNKIIVNPNALLHSTMDALHAKLLVAPPAGVPYYPAVIGAAGSTASNAASGFPGGVFGANPFMDMGIRPVLVRFFPDWAWAFGERGKGIMWQDRDPLEVVQEQPASGAAFDVDAYRFRSRRRFECDWVGSRFWWLGNDGTVTGLF